MFKLTPVASSTLSLVAIVGLLSFSVSSGTTRLVPGDFPIIRQAIIASFPGDTVLVMPGTYVENVLIDRNVVVRSMNGSSVTIIDGGLPADPFSASVVRISAGSIEGFDLRNGRGSYDPGSQGWRGGGILVEGQMPPGPLIHDNLIHDNVVVGIYIVEGGGIALMSTATARVIGNRVFHNSIQGRNSPKDSAICDAGPGADIEGNEVFDNRMLVTEAPTSTAQGTIFCREGAVTNNVVACNSGFWAYGLTCSGVVEGNTVVGNWSALGASAVFLWDRFDGVVRAYGNNVCFNLGAGLECEAYPITTYVVECNNVFGNGPPGQMVGSCADAMGVDGNISVDPSIERGSCPSAHGDWCLGPDSPLLPENSPPGCGLIGALGLCGPIAVPEIGPGSSPSLRALPAHPNPFFERATIAFYLPKPGEVEISIYGVLGRKIRTLKEGYLGAGDNEIEWDGRLDGGERAPSGAYVAVIRSGGTEVTRTLLLVR